MRISADRGTCIGSGVCVMHAPGVFDQDRDGIVVLLDPEPDSTHAEAARRAVHDCPSGGLQLVESEPGTS